MIVHSFQDCFASREVAMTLTYATVMNFRIVEHHRSASEIVGCEEPEMLNSRRKTLNINSPKQEGALEAFFLLLFALQLPSMASSQLSNWAGVDQHPVHPGVWIFQNKRQPASDRMESHVSSKISSAASRVAKHQPRSPLLRGSLAPAFPLFGRFSFSSNHAFS